MPRPIALSRTSEKWLEACLDGKLLERITDKIDELADMPELNGVEKIQGTKDMYRVRSGDYRIIFQYAPSFPMILIAKIAHRKEVYRGL